MAKKAACKCKKAECEECPEWIFTFADLVMLMMGFFVILWVTKPSASKSSSPSSSDENSELIKVEAGIRKALGYIPDAGSNDPVDRFMMTHDLTHIMLGKPQEKGQTDNDKGVSGREMEVTNIRPAKQFTQGGRMLFTVGSTTLNAETKTALDEIATLVKGHRNIVMIKGHTSLDDFPDGATAQQKMDLSLKRAQAAADYLVDHGVEPRIVRVQGCSTFEPLTKHQYGDGSQDENRRIEVEATNTLADDLDDDATTKPDR